MSKIKPLGDKVVIKPKAKEDVTASGIVLPDTADRERPEQGEVVAVGPDATKDLKVNDVVLFKKYSPDEFKIDGQEFLVLGKGDIIGIIE